MSALVVAGLALSAAQMVAKNKAAKKQKKAGKERDDAIEKENRKNSIARALGVGFTGTRRKMPSGIANTGTLDTLGGLAGLGSNLAFRNASSGGGGGVESGIAKGLIKSGSVPVADNQAILRQLQRNRQQSSGSFPITGTNIG